MRRRAVEYTQEEREQSVAYLLALRKSQIRVFLESHDLARSGTKEDLRSRIQEALDDGDLEYESLVQTLDDVTPWAKQHVQLYEEAKRPPGHWTDQAWVKEHLKKRHLG